MDDECCNNGTCACNINPIVEPEQPCPDCPGDGTGMCCKTTSPACPMGCGKPMRQLACDECATCDDCYPKLRGKPCCQEVACPHQIATPEVDQFKESPGWLRGPLLTTAVEPERATPWVAPSEECEAKPITPDLIFDVAFEKGVLHERARVRRIIEGRVAAWSGPGSGGGNAPLSDRIAVKDVLRDLLAALDEGANDE